MFWIRNTAAHRKSKQLLLQLPPNCAHASSSSSSFSRAQKSGSGGLASERGRLKKEVESLEQGKLQVDLTTYSCLFRKCCELQALSEGRRIHDHLSRNGLLENQSLGNLVLSFYGKYGCLEDSVRVFGTLAKRDVVSWNAMIAAYAAHACGNAGLQLYSQMQWEGLNPNRITIISLLNSFSGASALQDGKLVHAFANDAGFEQDLVVASALVNMYGRCESLENARKAFSRIPYPNVVAWNVLIGAYAQSGELQMALQLFEQMQWTPVKPDKVTFVILIDACVDVADLDRGKWLHTHIVDRGLEREVVVGNALVNMYGKCKSLEDANKVFNKMPEKDVVTWNSLIAANARLGYGEVAIRLFKRMRQEGIFPSRITFVSILSACASASFLAEGKLIHICISDLGFESDVAVLSGLVNMYSKCGSLEDALLVYGRMHRRNVITWNAIIAAYTQHGHHANAFQAFTQMQQEGLKPNKVTFVSLLNACSSPEALPLGKWIHSHILGSTLESDIITGNALINMYARCESLQDASMVFEKLPNRDISSWNSMIVAYANNGHGKDALELFRQLEQQKIGANNITFASILEVCANLNDLEEGRRIHAYMIDSCFQPDIVVENALVNMYGKCGSLEDAYQTFIKMSKRDLVSWNAIIAAFTKQEGKQALQIFGELQLEQVTLDHISIVGVLSACSHAGMVDEGCHYFVSVSQCYDIELTMEHYGCMVDLLGRAGQLEEAEDLISRMPFQPSAALWMALLGACRLYLDSHRAKRVAEHLLDLDPRDSAPYVLLSNIYAAEGKWEDVAKLRKLMLHQHVQKCPANSLIEIKNEDSKPRPAISNLQTKHATGDAFSSNEDISICADAA